ncbi:nucleotidyltransferase domain-containing protein [Cesiribacter andamanensis]|nr:nucleotidyltransferase [Cesiribacter andamanensis]
MTTVTEDHKKEAHAFYKEALTLLNESGAKYLMGGGFAIFHYTGIYRDTKDLDIFCKSSEYPKIMKKFAENGYRTELTDVRWLAKVFKGDHFMDIIFDTVNNICTVDDSWFEHATEGVLFDTPVLYLPAEELLWCKIYVQNREHFDGADVNHILLRWGKKLDWKRILDRLDQHWHLLLAQIIMFQFIYPADYREIVPKWLFDELMERAQQQYDLPSAKERVCRGPIIDQTQYKIDIKEWDYKVTTIMTV